MTDTTAQRPAEEWSSELTLTPGGASRGTTNAFAATATFTWSKRGYTWVTATADYDNPVYAITRDEPTMDRWLTLRDLLETLDRAATTPTTCRVHLPHPTTRAPGRVVAGHDTHEVVALARTASDFRSQYDLARMYRHVHPQWIAAQPPHTRALHHCGTTIGDGVPLTATVGTLTLDQLLDACGTLLDDTPDVQEAVARAVAQASLTADNRRRSIPLYEAFHLAAALR